MVTAIAARSVQISDVGDDVLIRDRRELFGFRFPWENEPDPGPTTTPACPEDMVFVKKRQSCVLMGMICPKGFEPNYELGKCVISNSNESLHVIPTPEFQ